ncbi:hypothetical protein [Hyalangium minutum]|uniref:hypothetical protein n=1 Tax=Hyalangium minutum TaxID=394096 RepID=UPI0012FA13B1|nr:hypothetical protein [Hyalangium minutum]
MKKWKTFERETARELRKLAPGAKRCLQFQRQHGAPDVEAGVLWAECKSGGHRPVERLYRETAEASKARKDSMPAVVTKAGTRGSKLVTLSLKDFIRVAKANPLLQAKLWGWTEPRTRRAWRKKRGTP